MAAHQSAKNAHGYPFALTVTIVPVLIAVAVLTAIGSEARHVRFGSRETAVATAGAPARAPA